MESQTRKRPQWSIGKLKNEVQALHDVRCEEPHHEYPCSKCNLVYQVQQYLRIVPYIVLSTCKCSNGSWGVLPEQIHKKVGCLLSLTRARLRLAWS